MSVEVHGGVERVYYECRLYGDDVYYGFAQYCFWRTVVRTQNTLWLASAPVYFLHGSMHRGSDPWHLNT